MKFFFNGDSISFGRISTPCEAVLLLEPWKLMGSRGMGRPCSVWRMCNNSCNLPRPYLLNPYWILTIPSKIQTQAEAYLWLVSLHTGRIDNWNSMIHASHNSLSLFSCLMLFLFRLSIIQGLFLVVLVLFFFFVFFVFSLSPSHSRVCIPIAPSVSRDYLIWATWRYRLMRYTNIVFFSSYLRKVSTQIRCMYSWAHIVN